MMRKSSKCSKSWVLSFCYYASRLWYLYDFDSVFSQKWHCHPLHNLGKSVGVFECPGSRLNRQICPKAQMCVPIFSFCKDNKKPSSLMLYAQIYIDLIFCIFISGDEHLYDTIIYSIAVPSSRFGKPHHHGCAMCCTMLQQLLFHLAKGLSSCPSVCPSTCLAVFFIWDNYL